MAFRKSRRNSLSWLTTKPLRKQIVKLILIQLLRPPLIIIIHNLTGYAHAGKSIINILNEWKLQQNVDVMLVLMWCWIWIWTVNVWQIPSILQLFKERVCGIWIKKDIKEASFLHIVFTQPVREIWSVCISAQSLLWCSRDKGWFLLNISRALPLAACGMTQTTNNALRFSWPVDQFSRFWLLG